MTKNVENKKLVQVIENLQKVPDNQVEIEFISQLMASKLLVPIQKNVMPTDMEEIKLEDNLIMSIQGISDPQGENYIPVFTDWKEFRKGNFGVALDGLVLSFSECQKIIVQSDRWKGIVINPYTHSLILTSENLLNIEKKYSSNINKGETVYFGEINEYPKDILEKLKKILRKYHNIKKAYFLQLVRNLDNRSYLLVIDKEKVSQEIFSEVGKEISKNFQSPIPIDMISYDTELGKASTKDKFPFYER